MLPKELPIELLAEAALYLAKQVDTSLPPGDPDLGAAALLDGLLYSLTSSKRGLALKKAREAYQVIVKLVENNSLEDEPADVPTPRPAPVNNNISVSAADHLL